jgi:Fe-Mn family superoxide dismutase
MTSIPDLTRRQALQILVASSAAAGLATPTLGGDAMADPTPSTRPAPAYRGRNEVKPLPFDPAKLTGLSEKLVTSHHQNNYAGAVKRLNQIQEQIGSLPRDAPPYQLGSLKREELIATNSMILHELYFGNLGGSGKPTGAVVELLKAEYESFEFWEQEFRLGCQSLAGGSGWMILNYDPHSASVHSYWAADHTNSLAGGMPLLVMDMYEHAYQMDYGANARGYIDAFFRNVNWDEVNRRAAGARKATAA